MKLKVKQQGLGDFLILIIIVSRLITSLGLMHTWEKHTCKYVLLASRYSKIIFILSSLGRDRVYYMNDYEKRLYIGLDLQTSHVHECGAGAITKVKFKTK